MWTIQKQMEQYYKTIEPRKLKKGSKYLFVKNNYKIFGIFHGYHTKTWSYINYGTIENHICDLSESGFKAFSLEDIKIRQVNMFFKNILPYEINEMIGKILSN